MLASGDGKLDTDYDSLAWELREEPDTIKSIINDFGLFVVEDGVFYSQRLNKELDNFNEKSEKAKSMAKKRWQKKDDAQAMPKQCTGNAQAMPKHNKSDAQAMPKQCTGCLFYLSQTDLTF